MNTRMILTSAMVFIVFSCAKEYQNPYDRECPPEIWAPENLTASENNNGVLLTWEQNVTHFDGFIIERSLDSIQWAPVNTIPLEKSVRNYTDTLKTPGIRVYYRIYAVADLNKSNFSYSKSISLPNFPSVSTATVYDISALSVTGGGNVTSDGGAPVTERGIVYGLSPHPTVADTKIPVGNGIGAFNQTVSGLSPCKTYYVRAYAINRIGTAYGEEKNFNTVTGSGQTGTFTDYRDGHQYKWVAIGCQVWMAENLAFNSLGSRTYENNEANAEIYGRLYDAWTALTACPTDWHLPSDNEWKQLEMTLGMTQVEANSGTFRGNIAPKMKTTYGWEDNLNGNNISGFSALPGGYLWLSDTKNEFTQMGRFGVWWCAIEPGYTDSWDRGIYYIANGINRVMWYGTSCQSVRCIKN